MCCGRDDIPYLELNSNTAHLGVQNRELGGGTFSRNLQKSAFCFVQTAVLSMKPAPSFAASAQRFSCAAARRVELPIARP
jgi:hypothetical protein